MPSRMKLTKNPVLLHYFSKLMGILLFVLKYMFISLLLEMINGFSWSANIMASPFKSNSKEINLLGNNESLATNFWGVTAKWGETGQCHSEKHAKSKWGVIFSNLLLFVNFDMFTIHILRNYKTWNEYIFINLIQAQSDWPVFHYFSDICTS